MYNYNPYHNQYNSYPQQVVKVNGANGARAYNMMPNSTALLLDENNPVVWFIQSDGAGYKTITPYKIEPYVEEKEPTIKELTSRIDRLEAMINESYTAKNEPETEQ